MNKEEIIQCLKAVITYDKGEGVPIVQYDNQFLLDKEDIETLLDYINQLETNIKDSIESHKETIQDTKDFYRPLEDTIYSGSTLIELAETHIEILERGKE